MPERRPNILFVMADQLTASALPFHGGPADAPTLEQLADEGVVFDSAYCSFPLCAPSRASLLTGRLPSRLGVYDSGAEFGASFPTVAHHLRDRGYATCLAGKMHFIGPDQLHGFEERLTTDVYASGIDWTPDWSLPLTEPLPWYHDMSSIFEAGPSEATLQLDYDEEVAFRSVRKIYDFAREGDRPFFLLVSFTHPHDPYCAPRKYLNMYRDVEIPMPWPYDDIRKLSPTYEWVRIVHGLDKETPSPEKVREARRCYLAMCTWIDDRIGNLLAEVERLGLARDTLIVLTSDHGDMCGEKGQWFKRIYLEWSARVPLIASWPGRIPAGKRVAAPVSLVDLLPTFAEAAGARVDTHIDGRSLLPLAEGREDGRDREVIGEYFGEATIEPVRMLRRGDYKYIVTHEYAPQLYDLRRDPAESANVAGRPECRAAEANLRSRIEKDWDPAGLKRRVMTSHAEREFLRSIPDYLVAGLWQPKVAEPVITDESAWR